VDPVFPRYLGDSVILPETRPPLSPPSVSLSRGLIALQLAPPIYCSVLGAIYLLGNSNKFYNYKARAKRFIVIPKFMY
jgi:hypothetical protein